MKLSTISLLVSALVAIGLLGCESHSSTPLATAPATTSATEVRQEPVTSTNSAGDSGEKKEVVQATHKTELEPVTPTLPTSESSTPSKENVSAEPPTLPDSAPTRPKADREPTKPGDPEKITFDDLILGMQADMVFRPFMLTDRAKELEGKRVRLTGEMYAGSVAGSEKLKEFIVLRNRECKYGAGGQADHVADVLMKEGHTTKFTIGTIRVEGTLRINPVNDDKTGVTNHIYVLEDAVVK